MGRSDSRFSFPAVLAFATVAVCAQPLAPGQVDPVVGEYAGTYAVDCRKAGSPRAHMSAQGLELEVENRRVRAPNPQTVLGYYGRSNPAGFEGVFMAEIKPGGGVTFEVWSDRIGHYLEISGSPEVEAVVGKALLKQKFRRCATAQVAQATNAASPGAGVAVVPPSTTTGAGRAPSNDPCAGAGTCYAAPTFVAEVTSVTTSRPSAGPVNATIVHRVDVRFRNLSNTPIVLAHRPETASMVDNQGNRYGYWNARVNVSGLGLLVNNAIDPSFVIGPNESRNATFEQRFVYDSRQSAPGTSFAFNLEVEEVERSPSQQWRTVRRNAVAFRDLSSSSSAGRSVIGAASPSAAVAAAPATTLPPSTAADPCNGAARCYAAPTFVAEVARVTTSRPSAGPVNATVVQRVDLRFRNITDRPIILAHRPETAMIVDNRGNRYGYWNARVNVIGIGLLGNTAVDPSFVLRPNESRNATFELRFVYDSRQAVPGNSFSFDLGIEEVEPTANQQLRSVRKNAVRFRDLSG